MNWIHWMPVGGCLSATFHPLCGACVVLFVWYFGQFQLFGCCWFHKIVILHIKWKEMARIIFNPSPALRKTFKVQKINCFLTPKKAGTGVCWWRGKICNLWFEVRRCNVVNYFSNCADDKLRNEKNLIFRPLAPHNTHLSPGQALAPRKLSVRCVKAPKWQSIYGIDKFIYHQKRSTSTWVSELRCQTRPGSEINNISFS